MFHKKISWKKILSLGLMAMFLMQNVMISSAGEEDAVRVKSKPGEVYAYDASNIYGEKFFIPTQVYQFGGEFYLADAYNNQVLHTSNVKSGPGGWKTVGRDLNRPHAIASDGILYLVVDTDNNRIVTYAKTAVGYVLVESIEGVGIRPHYVVYDSATKQFYVWSSMTGTMYIFKRADNALNLVLKQAKTIKALEGLYTRSFTIQGDTIYFPCVATSAIYLVNKADFNVKAISLVAPQLSEMVQIIRVQNYYYLVTSANPAREYAVATVARSTTLAGFGNGTYENVRAMFGSDLTGNPYYITQGEDGHFYTPVITGSCNEYICQFDIVGDVITNVNHLKY